MAIQDTIERYQNAVVQIATKGGTGTGFYLQAYDLIVTNNHVIRDTRQATIKGRTFGKQLSRVVFADEKHDLAFLMPPNNVNDFPELKLGEYSTLKDGDEVVAIGHPYGLNYTATQGVISRVDRVQQGIKYIQIDAAINPGNSGGPLCNINGEVIGINTAIIPFGTGLGFSIPINKAYAVAQQLIANRKVQHPFVGIRMKPISEDVQKEFGLPDQNGALVENVDKGSPAAKAGLQPGDVIRSIDGQVMKSTEDVQRYVGAKKVGNVLKVEILRNNTIKRSLNVTVGDRPDAE